MATHSTTLDEAARRLSAATPEFAERVQVARAYLARGVTRLSSGVLIFPGGRATPNTCTCQQARSNVRCIHQEAARIMQAADPPLPEPEEGGDCPDHGPHEGDECPSCEVRHV
jgi:hypothetical protein